MPDLCQIKRYKPIAERLRLFFATLVCGVLLSLWLASSVAAECGYFKPLGDLTAQMRLVATGQAPQGTATAKRVARHLQDIELEAVRQRLIEMKITAQIDPIAQLIATAAEYSRTKRTTDQVALMRNVHYLEALFEIICSSRLKGAANSSLPGSRNKSYLTSLTEYYPGLFSVGLLVVLLAAVVGLLFAMRYAARQIIGFVHHIKFCRVPGKICGGKQEFLGTVTRAGLDGVRFEFENDAEAKRLINLMASPGFVYFDLWIDNKNWPVFVDRFQKFFVPLYFLERLKRDVLSEILAKSTRATSHAPSIGHPSNRKIWRDQIKERKANIRNATRLRVPSG